MSQLTHKAKRKSSEASAPRPPLAYFLIVFGLSIPLWAIGAFIPFQLLPGLPVSALMVLCPITAASILVYREGDSVGALIRRAFDAGGVKHKVWYVPTLLIMPAITLVVYGLMRLRQMPLPEPQFTIVSTALMFLLFFIGGVGEETGWSGYVIDPLQEKWGWVAASLFLGLVTAVWHAIPFLQAGNDAAWIFWQGLTLITLRVVQVWLYNGSGKSVFLVVLFHAMINLTWQLFPSNGSHYDPQLTGLVSLVAAVILIIWGFRRPERSGLE